MTKPRFIEKRANIAEDVLYAYHQSAGGSCCGRIDLGTVRDLLEDLLHWIARHDPEGERVYGAVASLQDAFDTACNDFPHELDEEEE